jgi:hypothetical protein
MVAVVKRDHTQSANGPSEEGGHVGRLAQRFVIFIVFFLSACGAAAQSKSAFRIVESGYAAPRIGATLVWLDERRVLFTGGTLSAEAKARYPESGDAAKWANPWTFVWDTAGATVERISDWNTVCYSPTYIRQYKRPKNDPQNGLYRIGPPGQELELDTEDMAKRVEEDKARKRTYRNRFNCKSYAPNELVPPIPKGRRVVLLGEGDGYLDLGARDIDGLLGERKSGKVARWYSPRYPQGMELPIPLSEEPGLSGYSDAKAVYVVSADLGAPIQISAAERWRIRLPHRKYLLDARSGKVTSIDVTNFGDGSHVDRFTPTHTGWVFTGSAVPWQQRSGIYTFDGVSIVQREQGGANALAVSPDGCKVAYSINTEHTQMGSPHRVKFMNLCS